MIGLPNPWLILAAAGAIGAALVLGHQEGEERGRAEVQTRWDRREAELSAASAETGRLVMRASDRLQKERDDERERTAAKVASLGADVERLSERLSDRAERPAPGAAPAGPAPGPRPALCTGLGLYREDGMFLVGEAAIGKRIKLQRDECYAAYGRAQEEIRRLQGAPAD